MDSDLSCGWRGFVSGPFDTPASQATQGRRWTVDMDGGLCPLSEQLPIAGGSPPSRLALRRGRQPPGCEQMTADKDQR